jgi:16S rRNA pseudouridine516 synthase
MPEVVGEPLDRFLVRNGPWPWAEARRRIHWGLVTVDGVCEHRYHRRLPPGAVVAMDGETVLDTPDRSVLLCHKPAGWACSHAPGDAPLIYDLIPPDLAHPDQQTVGRLDRDTTGLLLFTLDGKFLQRVVAPGRKLPKRYRIAYSGTLVPDAIERVAAGLPIPGDERSCLPAPLTLDSDEGRSDDRTTGRPDGLRSATLVLAEGRHHQVKRMIEALGGRVERLHRDRIGGLDLPGDLLPGTMRRLTGSEREALGAG